MIFDKTKKKSLFGFIKKQTTKYLRPDIFSVWDSICKTYVLEPIEAAYYEDNYEVIFSLSGVVNNANLSFDVNIPYEKLHGNVTNLRTVILKHVSQDIICQIGNLQLEEASGTIFSSDYFKQYCLKDERNLDEFHKVEDTMLSITRLMNLEDKFPELGNLNISKYHVNYFDSKQANTLTKLLFKISDMYDFHISEPVFGGYKLEVNNNKYLYMKIFIRRPNGRKTLTLTIFAIQFSKTAFNSILELKKELLNLLQEKIKRECFLFRPEDELELLDDNDLQIGYDELLADKEFFIFLANKIK